MSLIFTTQLTAVFALFAIVTGAASCAGPMWRWAGDNRPVVTPVRSGAGPGL